MRQLSILLLTGLVFSVNACRKKDPPEPQPQPSSDVGQITLNFSNLAGDQPLVLDSVYYLNAHGDSFIVTNYAYYITNISLVSDQDEDFSIENSYYLVKEKEESSKQIALSDIKPGKYSAIKFLIGVDEARNTSGAQTGALDPMHSMFWDWNTGYIMAKLEGKSPQSTGPANFLGFHLGGFSGPESVLRWVTLSFPEQLVINTESNPTIHIEANMLQWFGPPNVINFSEVNIIMGPGLAASNIADNYAKMFKISHIHP